MLGRVQFVILSAWATTGQSESLKRNKDADRDLAKRFHQDALYYVEGDQLSVTHCDHRRSLVPIGSFRDRDDDDSKKGGWRCDGTTLGPFAVWTKAARHIAESANVRGTVRAGPFPR